MSMLAERRVKQRIGPDPQNKRWKNDKEKFGQKMLEKFGWSDGDGLGANLQGGATNIKLKPNTMQKGLGANNLADDNWLAHQDAFDDILKSLNASSSPTTASSSAVVDTSTNDRRSLEKQCTRIRYLKFARGKDLNSKSLEDVHEVLGKRSKRRRREEPSTTAIEVVTDTTTGEEESTPSTEKRKKKKSKHVDEEIEEKPSKMTTSSVNVQDYYKDVMAQKLAKLKSGNTAE